MNKISKAYLALGLAGYGLFTSAFPVFAAPSASLCGTSKLGADLCNTGEGFNLGSLAKTAINVVLFVAFVLALIFLIIGGIRWITSGGDKAQTENAKNAVTSALIGLAVVVGTYILINVVLSFFGVSGGLGGLDVPTITK